MPCNVVPQHPFVRRANGVAVLRALAERVMPELQRVRDEQTLAALRDPLAPKDDDSEAWGSCSWLNGLRVCTRVRGRMLTKFCRQRARKLQRRCALRILIHRALSAPFVVSLVVALPPCVLSLILSLHSSHVRTYAVGPQ